MDTIISRSVEETVEAGKAFANTLKPGDIIALRGGLGAGKTHFVKGIALGLKCDEPVTSPTFTIVHEYHGGRCPIFHMDWYRLEEAADLVRIGWDDLLQENGVTIVEWPERFPDHLPKDTQWLLIEILTPYRRKIMLH